MTSEFNFNLRNASEWQAQLFKFKKILPISIGNLEYEKSVVKNINDLLINNATRRRGLELLNLVIESLSPESFSDCALNWCGYCIIKSEEDAEREVKLSAVAKLLETIKDTDSFNKKFSTEYLNNILKSCFVYHNNAEKIAEIKCLTQCMKRYPAALGKWRIEPFLVDCLESTSEAVTNAAAIGYLCFLQTGSSGVNGINHVNNFCLHFKKLSNTILSLYKELTVNNVELANLLDAREEVYTVSTDTVPTVLNVINNCLTFMEILIIKRFPVEKRIFPKYVFDIITKGFTLHHYVIQLDQQNLHENLTLLSKLLNKLVRIFTAFVKGFDSSLAPFSAIIEKSIINNLQRGAADSNSLAFKTCYRISVYKTLIAWVSHIRIANELRFNEKVIPYIFNDIAPEKNIVTLNTNPGKGSAKIQDPIVKKLSSEDAYIDKICIVAFKALKCLIIRTVSFNKKELMDILFFTFKMWHNCEVDKVTAPYTNPACQLQLYEVFFSLLKAENCKMALPLHTFIKIFNKGLRSKNYKILELSQQALELMERTSHPVMRPFVANNHFINIEENLRFTESAMLTEEQECNNSASVLNNENEVVYAEESHMEKETLVDQSKKVEIASKEITINIESRKDDVVMKVADKYDLVLESNDKDVVMVDVEQDCPKSVKAAEPSNPVLEGMFDSFQDVIQEFM